MSLPAASFLDALLDGVLLVDAAELRVLAANRAASALLDRPVPRLVGAAVDTLLGDTPEDAAFWAGVAAGDRPEIESDTLLRRPDGSTVQVARRVSRADDGPIVVVLHDRRPEILALQRLELAVAELQATLESTADGILVTDLDGRIRRCNRRFAALWDLPEALLDRQHDDAVLDWMRGRVADPAGWMRRLAEADDDTQLPATDLIALQSGRTLERVIRPLVSLGRRLGRVHSFRDVSERIAARARIEQLSGTDALTGLANRQRLAAALEAALARSTDGANPFALLLVDLDRFRPVNESLGQERGDRLLAEVGARLAQVVRQGDLVARLAADQFALLLPSADLRGAQGTAQRVLDALAAPHRDGPRLLTVTGSVGIALHPEHGSGADALLAAAEAAVHEAKDAGRATARLARPAHGDAHFAVALDQALREALASGRFRVHWQPQVALADGTICGVEALIRWRDPLRGDVSPAVFIPAAEASGLIGPIGAWVLRQALQQAAAWRRQGRALRVSVNVSAVQFRQPGFVDEVAAALRAHELPGDWLELELTESTLLRDAAEVRGRFAALAALGVRLAIDDFGTGFSSLGYLKQLPIARLKIDRGFIRGLPEDARDAGIVRAVLQMGRSLGIAVVAEGVETEAQRAFLADAGCAAFQGFLVAPALPAAAFEELHDRMLAPA